MSYLNVILEMISSYEKLENFLRTYIDILITSYLLRENINIKIYVSSYLSTFQIQSKLAIRHKYANKKLYVLL
jgi:hypothetical protein